MVIQDIITLDVFKPFFKVNKSASVYLDIGKLCLLLLKYEPGEFDGFAVQIIDYSTNVYFFSFQTNSHSHFGSLAKD